jgi:hypothetical protein
MSKSEKWVPSPTTALTLPLPASTRNSYSTQTLVAVTLEKPFDKKYASDASLFRPHESLSTPCIRIPLDNHHVTTRRQSKLFIPFLVGFSTSVVFTPLLASCCVPVLNGRLETQGMLGGIGTGWMVWGTAFTLVGLQPSILCVHCSGPSVVLILIGVLFCVIGGVLLVRIRSQLKSQARLLYSVDGFVRG